MNNDSSCWRNKTTSLSVCEGMWGFIWEYSKRPTEKMASCSSSSSSSSHPPCSFSMTSSAQCDVTSSSQHLFCVSFVVPSNMSQSLTSDLCGWRQQQLSVGEQVQTWRHVWTPYSVFTVERGRTDISPAGGWRRERGIKEGDKRKR